MEERSRREHALHLEYLKNPFGLEEIEGVEAADAILDKEDPAYPLKSLTDEHYRRALQKVNMTDRDFALNFSNSYPPGQGSPYHPCHQRRKETLLSTVIQVPTEAMKRTPDQNAVVNYHFHKACGLGCLDDMHTLLAIGASIHSKDEVCNQLPAFFFFFGGEFFAVVLGRLQEPIKSATTSEAIRRSHQEPIRTFNHFQRLERPF